MPHLLAVYTLDVSVHRRTLVHIVKKIGDNFRISVTDSMILNSDVTCQFHWDSLFLCSKRTRCLISALSDHRAAACAFMGLSLLGSEKKLPWFFKHFQSRKYICLPALSCVSTSGMFHPTWTLTTSIQLKWLSLLHCIQVLGWILPHSPTILHKVFVFLSVHPVDTRSLSQIGYDCFLPCCFKFIIHQSQYCQKPYN